MALLCKSFCSMTDSFVSAPLGQVPIGLLEKNHCGLLVQDGILSLRFKGHFPGGPGLASTRMSPFWISMKQDDCGGGDNLSYKTCKDPVKSSPPTNQHPDILQAGCPSCRPTDSVKALNGNGARWYYSTEI